MLTLPIKAKWFNMILSGEKKEEYRDYTQYYYHRFCKYFGVPIRVKFRNGYNSNSPSFERTVIPHYGEGKPEWGAEEGKKYFVLTILDEPEGDQQK
jgi:hypothetical protein